MWRIIFAALAAMVMAAASPSFATICAHDNVPAATLLFPFVVYDYNAGSVGDSTELAITNTGPDAQIAHITIWSDTHIPVLAFNILLSGYDIERFNIRDVLRDGYVPSTGHGTVGGVAEHGPVDGVVNLAAPASTTALFQRCPVGAPGYPGNIPPIPAGTLNLIQSWLQLSQTVTRVHSDCAGSTYPGNTWNPEPFFDTRTTDDPTWMYVTADVVWTCNLMLPDVDAALYWEDGPANNPSYSTTGAQRMTDNVLMGDVIWVNQEERFSESVPAVHIEADDGLGDTSYNSPVRNATTGRVQSFAHTQSSPHGVSDQREPLPTAWAFRYMHVPSVDLATTIRVWKAPTLEPDLDFDYSLGNLPTGNPWAAPNVGGIGSEMAAFDCLAYTYYAWDDDEQVVTGSGSYPNRLPLAVQEIPAGEFLLPDSFGWMLFTWPPSNTDQADHYQTWMGVKMTAYGQFSTAHPGTVMGNANCVQPGHASGFELGDTSGWDATRP